MLQPDKQLARVTSHPKTVRRRLHSPPPPTESDCRNRFDNGLFVGAAIADAAILYRG